LFTWDVRCCPWIFRRPFFLSRFFLLRVRSTKFRSDRCKISVNFVECCA
jgi:hypothetical protein